MGKLFKLGLAAVAGLYGSTDALKCYSCNFVSAPGAEYKGNVDSDLADSAYSSLANERCMDMQQQNIMSTSSRSSWIDTISESTSYDLTCYTTWKFPGDLVHMATPIAVSRGAQKGVDAMPELKVLTSNTDLTQAPQGVIWCNGDTAGTTCHSTCTGDLCNMQTAAMLTPCKTPSGTCGAGYCDYMSGTCMCDEDHDGVECENLKTATEHTCVQCKSVGDSGCWTKTESTTCSYDENRPVSDNKYKGCGSVRTLFFDDNGNFQGDEIVRGCNKDRSIEFMKERPVSLGTYDMPNKMKWNWVTYMNLCNGNGCNTIVPDGKATGDRYCIQCDDNDDKYPNCDGMLYNNMSPCPSGQNFCAATVKYSTAGIEDVDMTQNSEDFNMATGYAFADPRSVAILSVRRYCSATAVTKKCDAKNIASTTTGATETNAMLNTCQESCSQNGCNFGWPARPLCAQCFSEEEEVGTTGIPTNCVANPPPSVSCPSPHQSHCYVTSYGSDDWYYTDRFAASQARGVPHGIVRGCTADVMPDACVTKSHDNSDHKYEVCSKTCSESYCNYGNGAATIKFTILSFIPFLYFLF